MNVSAVAFDWGGVIYQYPGGNFNDAAAAFLRVDIETFRHAYFLHNHMTNKKGGEAFENASNMWRAVLGELRMPDRLDAFMEFVRTRPEGFVSEEMVSLVRRVKRLGRKVGLLSNTSAEGARMIRRQPCFTLFDVALFSAEINAMKPEPEAFARLASALDVDMRELVFIDDSERSLSTADEVGYVPIRFTDTKRLTEDLERLGLV